MNIQRKFSVFISSTYEDLKMERQALMGVALENDFIPVGMEQFHAAPASQWDVITKMIDECDFYLLVIGGRYGSIDDESGLSYTEKEYNYAKEKSMPVIVLVKDPSEIKEKEMDEEDDNYTKRKRLKEFRNKVKAEKNTVDTFRDLDNLKYKASQAFKNAVDYADENAGWVRYRELEERINEIKNMSYDNVSLYNGSIEGVTHIPLEPAFLLVYAAEGDGKILKLRALGSPVVVSASRKQFMADNSHRESARWQSALEQLIKLGWVKATGCKDEIFEVTGDGYKVADILKDRMDIDTSVEPIEEMKKFE